MVIAATSVLATVIVATSALATVIVATSFLAVVVVATSVLAIRRSARDAELRQNVRKLLLRTYIPYLVMWVVFVQAKTYMFEPADSIFPTPWFVMDVLAMEETETCSFHAKW